MIPELKKEIKQHILDFKNIDKLKNSNNVEQTLHFSLGAIAALEQVLSKMDYLVKDDMALLGQIDSQLRWLSYSIEQFKKYPQGSFQRVIISRSCDDLKYYCETMLYRIEDQKND
jgi:hypothetical protein